MYVYTCKFVWIWFVLVCMLNVKVMFLYECVRLCEYIIVCPYIRVYVKAQRRLDSNAHIMMSYLLLMTFLANGIQAQQHWLKKCVDYKGEYVEKLLTLGHIPWEYFGQPLNFSADPGVCVGANTIIKHVLMSVDLCICTWLYTYLRVCIWKSEGFLTWLYMPVWMSICTYRQMWILYACEFISMWIFMRLSVLPARYDDDDDMCASLKIGIIYAYVYVWIYMRVHVWLYVSVRVRVHVCLCMCWTVYVLIYLSVYMVVWSYLLPVRECVLVNVWVYIYIYIYI